MLNLIFEKDFPEALNPEFAYESDLGSDLKTPWAFIIEPKKSHIVNTGIKFEIPELEYPYNKMFRIGGFIWPRSGLSCKNDVETGAGVVDTGYRGVIKVHLYNFGSEPVSFERGDKIAQIVFKVCPIFDWVTEGTVNTETHRGDKGFGSSGT